MSRQFGAGGKTIGRIVADRTDRVAFMKKHYHLSTELATEVVDKMSRRRISKYKKFGKTDYDQPHLYHLVLNMSKIDLKTATDLVFDLTSS